MKWGSNMVNNNTVTFARFETPPVRSDCYASGAGKTCVLPLYPIHTVGNTESALVFKDNLPSKMDYFSV